MMQRLGLVVRRIFFVEQFVAAVALPLWLLTGYAVFGSSAGTFVAVALLAPVLVVAELALAGVVVSRRSVRLARAVSLPDVGLLAAFHLAVIGAGFFSPASVWFAVIAVAAAIAAFWFAVMESTREAAQRVRETWDSLGLPRRAPAAPRGPIDAGEYIVIPRSAPGR